MGRALACASVVSQKFVEYVSPRSGRKRVAHGASRGFVRPPHPRPLSRWGGRGVPQAG